jgi:diacylglycerol kinase (ATP)
MRIALAAAITVRITLIHNPTAGRQRRGEASKLVELLESAGHDVRYRSVKQPGWKRTLKKKADLVVVAGGDGTVGKVARRMVGRGIPVALLPCGTANNIARSLEQTERPFEELIRGWDHARHVKLDAGVARGPWGERYFIEGVGAGLFADALANPTGARLKARADPVASALQRLRDFALHSEPLEITGALDGEDISGRYVMIEALNMAYVGPNLHLAYDSHPGDGELSVVMITEEHRERLLYYLEHWQENRERLAMLPTRRGQRLKIEWTGFALHIDDKLKPETKLKPKQMAGMVEARIDGAAVEFLVPA